MTETDDLVLIKRCLAGDVNAFEPLVEKYEKPIYNAALKMLNRPEVAEDITQTVFLRAFEKLDTFKHGFKFFSWIYRMAINATLDYLNKAKPSEALAGHLIAEEKSPEERMLDTELQLRIQAALMHLTPEYRSVIILRHFEEFSYNEIGYILDIPEKTVKSRLFSARQVLKEILIHEKS